MNEANQPSTDARQGPGITVLPLINPLLLDRCEVFQKRYLLWRNANASEKGYRTRCIRLMSGWCTMGGYFVANLSSSAGRRLLRRIDPSIVATEKYEEETKYWEGGVRNLKAWFIDGTMDWWGLPPPREDQKQTSSSLWLTNAVMTMHALRPTYQYEELGLERNAFNGQRVLEVGCGPLVPLLQFDGCQRYGVDPVGG